MSENEKDVWIISQAKILPDWKQENFYKSICGTRKVFNVVDGFLLACFDHDVTEETVKAIAQMKPYYTVFCDSSMANDSVATNFDQIFETYSPDTIRKVL